MDRLSLAEPPAAPPSLPVTLEALAREAWSLEMPFPFERRSVLGWEAGTLVDALLARVARGRGALEVAMGDGLAALAVGDRVLRLGYSGIGDYARERMGVAGRTAQAMARLARELRARPLLGEAVRRGEVSPRKAQAVLPVAAGAAEAAWVERARVETVRALEAAVREAGGPADLPCAPLPSAGAQESEGGCEAAGPGEEWEHVALSMSPEARERLDDALDLAGRLLGAASPRWQRVEAICQEYVGAHPEADAVAGGGEARGAPSGPWETDDGSLDPEDRGAATVELPRRRAASCAWDAGLADDAEPGSTGVWDVARGVWVGRPGNPSCGVPAPGGRLADGEGGCGGRGRAVEGAPHGGFAPRERSAGGPAGAPELGWLEALKVQLEEETERWAHLAAVDPVPAPGGSFEDGDGDPRRLDAGLRELVAMRDRWDELVGHLSMLMQGLGLWRHIGFATFGQYCAERLGMAQRTVEQRTWLERRLQGLPELRRAMREGRVSYEKARVVAGRADEGSEEAWIERAERSTCIALLREAEAEEDAQVRARGDLSLRLPVRVAALLESAVRAARRVAGPLDGRWLDDGGCLVQVAVHFLETWGPVLKARPTPARRAVDRDGGLCQVPGCSRAAAHAHHLRFRSAGGTDEAGNLVALCAAHHLHGVHRGWVRVRGRAPDELVWELGEEPAAA